MGESKKEGKEGEGEGRRRKEEEGGEKRRKDPASSASLPRIARVIIIGTLAVALKEEPEAAGLAPSEAGLAPSEAAFF